MADGLLVLRGRRLKAGADAAVETVSFSIKERERKKRNLLDFFLGPRSLSFRGALRQQQQQQQYNRYEKTKSHAFFFQPADGLPTTRRLFFTKTRSNGKEGAEARRKRRGRRQISEKSQKHEIVTRRS